jgi:hypothetical protein
VIERFRGTALAGGLRVALGAWHQCAGGLERGEHCGRNVGRDTTIHHVAAVAVGGVVELDAQEAALLLAIGVAPVVVGPA